jgi:enoyl-CoA hydratase/carnithine racemase
MVRGGDNRVFSSGGDLAALYAARQRGDRRFGETYFREEFQLDHLIATYPKPIMSVLNGLTLGGGAGISMHAVLRVATDSTLFAMPETGLGYFPDCGAAIFLNRCPGSVGTYLALTGQRLQAPDLCALGLATHYVPLAALPELDFTTLERLAQPPRPAAIPTKYEVIDTAFSAASITGICDRLRTMGAGWGGQALATLERLNPLSLKVALRQMHSLRGLHLAAVFAAEFRICQHFLDGDAFYEGMRAAVIDKDRQPNWPPPGLAELDQVDIDGYFDPIAGIADWRPLLG